MAGTQALDEKLPVSSLASIPPELIASPPPAPAGPLSSDHDRAAERRLLRKLDLRVVPMIAIMYMLAFIDRANLGNAKIQGLEKDLHMNPKGHDYNIAAFIFFVPYILCEVPSNLLLRKFRPSVWLSSLMALWGIVTICQGITQSFAGLVVCRMLLGFFEAGFLPGCIYLMSMYYRRFELQRRFTLFYSLVYFSGAFSGLLAYALAKMKGIGGYNGWRWIFIIEGLLTVAVAMVARFIIVDWPEQASFLTEEERFLLQHRLSKDVSGARMDRFDAKARRRAFLDWKSYLGGLMYLGIGTGGYGLAFFMPTILHQLGWTAQKAQVMTIPVYCVGAVIAILTAFISDFVKHRYGFIVLGFCVAIIGYIILIVQKHGISIPVQYMALFFVDTGCAIAQATTLVWTSNNLAGHYKRSVGAGIQISFGSLAGIIASNVFIATETPTYRTGYGVSMGFMVLALLAASAFFFGIYRENQKRDRGERNDRNNLPDDERNNLGDDDPAFRFVY